MCVSTINDETNNPMIQEKGPTKNEAMSGMGDSATVKLFPPENHIRGVYNNFKTLS